jgi:hypothetical protein
LAGIHEHGPHQPRCLMLDFVAMLLRDRPAQRIRFTRSRNPILGAIRSGAADQIFDRFEVARIPARPFLQPLDKWRAGVNAPNRLEYFDDFVAAHRGVFARQNGRAKLMNDGQQPMVELLLAKVLVIERHEFVYVTAQLFDSLLLRVWVGQGLLLRFLFARGTDGFSVFRLSS